MVTEGEDLTVDLCLAIVSPNITCPIAFSFELLISTEDVEAGIFHWLSVFIIMLVMVSPL